MTISVKGTLQNEGQKMRKEAVVTLNYRIYRAIAHLNLAIMAVILSVPMPSAVESAHISSRRHSTGGHIF